MLPLLDMHSSIYSDNENNQFIAGFNKKIYALWQHNVETTYWTPFLLLGFCFPFPRCPIKQTQKDTSYAILRIQLHT